MRPGDFSGSKSLYIWRSIACRRCIELFRLNLLPSNTNWWTWRLFWISHYLLCTGEKDPQSNFLLPRLQVFLYYHSFWSRAADLYISLLLFHLFKFFIITCILWLVARETLRERLDIGINVRILVECPLYDIIALIVSAPYYSPYWFHNKKKLCVTKIKFLNVSSTTSSIFS